MAERILDGMGVERHEAYHWIEAARYLYAGGFRYGHGIVTMLAISQVESDRGIYRLGPVRFDPQRGPVLDMNVDGTYDRGWLMVNSVHAQYTDEAMADPELCAGASFAISGWGENFRPWTQWKTGAYRPHMDPARFAVALLYDKVLKIPKPTALEIALYP